jgi:hypothetical protein
VQPIHLSLPIPVHPVQRLRRGYLPCRLAGRPMGSNVDVQAHRPSSVVIAPLYRSVAKGLEIRPFVISFGFGVFNQAAVDPADCCIIPTFTQSPSCPNTSNRAPFGDDLTIFALVLGSARMLTEAALTITPGFGSIGAALINAGAAAASVPMRGPFLIVWGRKVGPCQRNATTRAAAASTPPSTTSTLGFGKGLRSSSGRAKGSASLSDFEASLVFASPAAGALLRFAKADSSA